jgi:hypothetical protein
MRDGGVHSPQPSRRLETEVTRFRSHGPGKDMASWRSDRDPKCTVEKVRTRGTILAGAKFLAQQSVGGRGHFRQ